MMIYSIFLVFLTLFFIFSLIKHLKKSSSKNSHLLLPPGPTGLPLIGALHLLDDLPHRAFHKLSSQYGPLMFLQLGSIPTLVVSSSDIATEIFKYHDITFSDRPVLYAAKTFSYNCSTMSFAPYGDYWREIRKIVMLELLSSKRVQAFQAVRAQELELFLDSIARESSASRPVNLSELTLLLSNNIVCRIAFGKRRCEDSSEEGDGDYAGKFHDMLRETQELLGGFCLADFFPWLGWVNKFNGLDRRIQKAFRELDEFLDTIIKEHKEFHRHEAEHEDLVDVLIRIQNDPNQAISITNDQIKGVLLDIFVAGTDTSSATLVWTMTELIRNPEVMRKAQEEVRKVGKHKEMLEESDVSNLTYLKLVVKESLRLHPPAPLLLPRETTQACTIKGFHIPAKTRVFVNAKAIATDPNGGWENPLEFKPERFLESSVDHYKGQRFEMLPFGGGRRACPGVNFAMPMIEFALANLLCRFEWKLPSGVKSEQLDMDEAFGLTMHKKYHLCLVANPHV
ncbi:cytochrome P450 71A9-like [Senna tora]|uniref:Cytochrome P450 71A9-like n=1 Tax=Senna tora TaxID=362788 RepID=A0A834X4U1_9FABA|nr:cytochrome P450 71A9-like [Senna tora]